jgi:2-polyprenyl-3-methyl-5-hydroxy-6-metoxy-1,4-benzoquinol methylase
LNTAAHLAVKLAGKNKNSSPLQHLDIGSGHGELIEILRTQINLKSSACDYTEKLMRLNDVRVDVVDLNNEKIPYNDNQFQIVTCTEVLEHLEHYRETIREVHRVLAVDGFFLLTTPNILNLKSRIRFFLFLSSLKRRYICFLL